MLEAKIIKTGRGPEVAGTRITVYDVIEYYKAGWHRDMIAATLSLSSQQVEAAIRYIEENRDEVMASYERNMERIRRGNPPELQAKLDLAHERLQARLRELREAKSRGGKVRGILADINVGAQGRTLLSIWTSASWRDLWQDLGLVLETFPNLGLADNASDAFVWRTCQREGLVLITGNRNNDGPDSLEATIRVENQPDSLPVITIADTKRVLKNRLYAEKVAERLLERLIAIDDFRGAGRIYVP